MKTSLEVRRGRRRIAMTLIALAAPLIALFGFAAPASAAPSYCSLGRACVWDDSACFYDTATGGYGGSSVCLNTNQGDGNIENSSGIVQGLAWDPNAAKFV